eukprot:m.16134 g.16134  ORF g.16134 m.16134 type:complete len:243 (-) comp3478_c1_seq1:141-869(-)
MHAVPAALLQLPRLERLNLASNLITALPDGIGALQSLTTLLLGGNQLATINPRIGNLTRLRVLYLGDNKIRALPSTLSALVHLEVLNLHNNGLTMLPREVLGLTALRQLSLRGNPLVTDFIHELPQSPMSLREMCARTIKNLNIPYRREALPASLRVYLDSARHCSNPACAGVYFAQGVKSVEFVDFCGKYRVPLMKYLCSPCHDKPCGVRDHSQCAAKMRRVLLTGFVEAPNDDQDGEESV